MAEETPTSTQGRADGLFSEASRAIVALTEERDALKAVVEQLVEAMIKARGAGLAIRVKAPHCNGACNDDPCIWRLAQQLTEAARTALAAAKETK